MVRATSHGTDNDAIDKNERKDCLLENHHTAARDVVVELNL
jgi:hypothetical protein